MLKVCQKVSRTLKCTDPTKFKYCNWIVTQMDQHNIYLCPDAEYTVYEKNGDQIPERQVYWLLWFSLFNVQNLLSYNS